MKYLINAFALLFFFSVGAQVKFEKGYIIDNSGVKTDCFIKNKSSENNPSTIFYKFNLDDSEGHSATVNDIKGFGIGNSVKFESFNIVIDKEENNVYKFSDNKHFEFIDKKVFLKVLVAGKASLYYYQDGYSYRFFYSKDLSNVSQLVYKKYRKSSGEIISKNEKYKNQLFVDLKCKDLTSNNYRKLKYFKKELVDFFNLYNNCEGQESVNYLEVKKAKFRFKLKSGVNFANIDVKYKPRFAGVDVFSTKFETSSSLRVGAEFECVLPFNRNKWAVFIEPTFSSFKGESIVEIDNFLFSNDKASVDYSFVEFPIGIKHYMYFMSKKQSSIFINFAFVFSLDIGDNVLEYENNDNGEIESGTNFVLGIGYTYDKYSVELRTSTNRSLSEHLIVDINYNPSIALNFGYKLF